MKTCISTCLWILIVFTSIKSYAQIDKENVLFVNISNKQGLSHNTVYDVVQDSSDYMWFATSEGLNRYDGNKLKVFLPEEDNNKSIGSNHIKTLFVDSRGDLFVGGNKGVSRYLSDKGEFDNYNVLWDTNVSAIIEDSQRNIWIATLDGDIYKYNRAKNKFVWHKISKLLSNVQAMCMHNNNILIAGEEGLYVFDYLKGILVHEHLGLVNINDIIKSNNNNIWIATEGNGVYKLDYNLNIITNYISKGDDNSLVNNYVRSLQWDNNGNLWIGSFIGLSILNIETNTFTNIKSEFGKYNTLSHNSVRSLYCDKQGSMWLGTFFGGVDYYSESNVKFRILNQNGGEFSLNDNIVSTIKEDADSNIWIATNDKGLNFWDYKTHKFKYYSHKPKDNSSLSSNNIKSIEFINSSTLLVGTHNRGLNLFSPSKNKNKIYTHNKNKYSIASDNIYALLKDSKNNIWVGTWKGLDRFDLEKQKFYHHRLDCEGMELSSPKITYLLEDSRSRIWIGTANGLNIFYPDKNIFEVFKRSSSDNTSISCNEISCVMEDSKGRIWIATRDGLNVFDELNRSFVKYTCADGLPNNAIYGILEDQKGKLWISSNGGLSCLDTEKKIFKNYDITDGIQAMQFCNYSFCKAQDGDFLFGGINGISIFNPQNMKPQKEKVKLLLEDFYLYGEKIKLKDNLLADNNNINNIEKIVLNHKQNVFAISYTAINYHSSLKLKFKYILEGFDSHWQTGNDIRKVQYTNVPAGEYMFKLKVYTDDAQSSQYVKQINILVKKAWWITYWAILVYLCIIIAIVLFMLRLFNKQINTNNQLRIERLEKDKLEDINKLKLKFFTNISHEFRTPLTLIISPLQKIIEKEIGNDWLNKQHVTMLKSANRLLRLINQLLEFRKSELGELKLSVAQDDIVNFVNDIYLSFTGVASQNNIVYTFDCSSDKLIVMFDKNYLEKIVYNLLSNAFKYTPNSGAIELNVTIVKDRVLLKVSDSGKGIPEDKRSLIFERYYRIDESSSVEGSGIGLALTKRLVDLHHGYIHVEHGAEKGSVFILSLPMNKDAYQMHEIVEQSNYIRPLAIEKYSEVYTEDNSYTNEHNKDVSIMIVDDNKDICAYLRDSLIANFNITLAGNGQEALDMINQEMPDLIISDIMMPVMDGVKFCKTIKKNIKTCHIPIILLTAKSSLEDQIDGLDIGADDYMAKPFAMNLLEAKINNILKTRRRLKQYYSESSSVEPNKLAFNVIDEELLNKAIKIIEDNISKSDISVDFFAKEMGMSRSNLHLKLKAITGESASDFIKKIQFSKAKFLLAENRYSVAEISYMVGFNSPSYFSTSFKKYFGYLPSEYLDKCKNKRI